MTEKESLELLKSITAGQALANGRFLARGLERNYNLEEFVLIPQ
jgi:hypothetical protein